MSNEVKVELDLELTDKGVWPGLTLANGVKLIESGELGAVWTAQGVTAEWGDQVVALRIDLGGGRVAIVETSVRAIQKVAAVLCDRYGERAPKQKRPYSPPTLRVLDPAEVMRMLALEEADRMPGGGEHQGEDSTREAQAPELGDLAVTREPIDQRASDGDENGE